MNEKEGKEEDAITIEDIERMPRTQMQKVLKGWNQPATGRNAELRERLAEHLERKEKSREEKRLKKYRPQCPQSLLARIDRAKTQRLYLIERSPVEQGSEGAGCSFVVLGSTGNVYRVRISKVPGCTCPDMQRKNVICKHILFVYLKVIGLSPASPCIYQAALLSSELEEMFQAMNQRHGSLTVLANRSVRTTYASLSASNQENHTVLRKPFQDQDCPICFDAMREKEELTYCRGTCGSNFHIQASFLHLTHSTCFIHTLLNPIYSASKCGPHKPKTTSLVPPVDNPG